MVSTVWAYIIFFLDVVAFAAVMLKPMPAFPTEFEKRNRCPKCNHHY